jgi:hypothetical protein
LVGFLENLIEKYTLKLESIQTDLGGFITLKTLGAFKLYRMDHSNLEFQQFLAFKLYTLKKKWNV